MFAVASPWPWKWGYHHTGGIVQAGQKEGKIGLSHSIILYTLTVPVEHSASTSPP